jgi:hypothetical protein
MFRACDDPLLELFESFIESIVPGSTLDASRALSSASVVVKKMRLRLEAREALQDRGEEGFVYTIPGLPWKLGSKIEDLLKLARNQVYVSNPFIDDTTFALLRSVPSHAKILLLTTDDPYLKGKIDRRELTQVAAKTFSTGQTVEFRELEDLHARFLLVDNKCALFLSTDLKTGSISDKFQYVYFTTSPEIVKSCAAYFDSMWT